MAKRRAEAVACCAPYQPPSFPRAPPSKRSRSDLERRESRAAALWRENGAKKRKWTVVAEGGDEAESGGKRLAGGTARRREPEQRLPAVAGMATETAALAGGDATGSQGGPEKSEDDVWHYNSFQFWKLPLPTIGLSDIQELEKASITETRSSSNTSLSEMET